MELRNVTGLIDRQDWLGPVADTVQESIRSVYAAAGPAGQQVKNFLHGTWLGHPLHAVLTDVPLGAWTVALLLDALEDAANQHELAPAADLAVIVGLAGAGGAALAGLTDWEHLGGRAGKVGLVHGAMNTTATLLYIGSLLCRRNGQRAAGRALAYMGYKLAAASAYLGGELVYSQQIGVDHVVSEAKPEKFVAAVPEEDLVEAQPRRVEVDGAPVMVVRKSGHIYAMADTCSHLGCSLAQGELSGDSIVCRCHGSRYALEDGRVLDGPSVYNQPYFDARVRKGQVEVRPARADAA
jgi:nitrite reductase/ring-hydroxylating ferredoxin subunit